VVIELQLSERALLDAIWRLPNLALAWARFASSPLAWLHSVLTFAAAINFAPQLLSFVDEDQKLRAISVSHGIARRSTA
jgi:hypothetical protein